MTHPDAPSGRPEQGGWPPVPPPVELGPTDPAPPAGTPYHRNFDPSQPLPFPGDPKQAPKKPSWFARHKVATAVLAAVGVLVLLGGIGAAMGGSTSTGAKIDPTSIAVPTMPPLSSEQKEANASASNATPAPPAPTAGDPTTTPAPPATPDLTVSQQNAVESAQSYLESQGFSRSGLVTQLAEFEGFSKADATFAVDRVHADWNEQAVRVGQSYLDSGSFSRRSLITQLVEFEGFTRAQATYAVNKLGL